MTIALQRNEIAAAALDVTEPEPLPRRHPLLSDRRVIVTPHIGSATHRARNAMADISVSNVIAGLSGERLPHCVNPAVYGQK